MATKNISHVGPGAIVGSIAVGSHAHSEGVVNVGTPAVPPSQEEHKKAIKQAQSALLEDQESLSNLVYEGLHQFLRIARDIQVEQKSLAEAQRKMKDTLDDIWAQQAAKGLKPELLPTTLEIAKVLLSNPLMAEVAKSLFANQQTTSG